MFTSKKTLIIPDNFRSDLTNLYKTEFVSVVFDEIEKTNFVDYQSLEELDFDIGIRAWTLQAMHDINKNKLFEYAQSTSSFGVKGSPFWERKPLKIVQKPNCSAMQALDDLFRYGGAQLDCERSADVCVLRGVAQAFRCHGLTNEFNNLFTSPIELKHRAWRVGPGQNLSGIPTQFRDINKVPILPGDRRYFVNLEDYIILNPGGLASGEHTIYMGKDSYHALDFSNPKTYEKIIIYLAGHYDINQNRFKNFLYEEFNLTNQFREWSTLLPRVHPTFIKKIQEHGRDILNEYRKEIAPIQLTADNINEHLDELRYRYFPSLCKKIDIQNNQAINCRIRCIDIPALLKKSFYHQTKKSNTHHQQSHRDSSPPKKS